MKSINTDRLVLRSLTADDATFNYAGWLNDPNINMYLEARHSIHSVDTCRDFIIKSNSDTSSNLFGIFLKDDLRHIGNAKIGFVHSIYRCGQLSLFIGDKSTWGLGFGSEVVSALTNYGFIELGLRRIEAGCYEQNLASLRIFLKAGYSVEGFLRSNVVLNGQRQGCFKLGLLSSEFH